VVCVDEVLRSVTNNTLEVAAVQLSCAARSVSTFFEAIVLCPFSEKLKAGRDARLACGC